MGRKMKMGHLDEKECEWIMGVIHRDFDLRHKEQERLNKIESELNEAATQRSILAKRKEFNEKCCILCCAAFNLLFNKKLQCGNCNFHVCRNCATWESQSKVWLCRVCEQQRLLYIQSCEWFYDHIRQRFQHFGSAKVLDTLRRKRKESGVDSENDSGYGPAFSEGKLYKGIPAISLNFQHLLPGFQAKLKNEDNRESYSTTGSPDFADNGELTEVRQHIETVVEGLVGENVDTARVDKPYSHPQYLHLFNMFHKPLVGAITKLSQALYVALQNKPPEGDLTPTSAHAALKQSILELGEKVAVLPCLEERNSPTTENGKANESSKVVSKCSQDIVDSYIFQSYEDLLASAIINKLVDRSQKLQYGISGRDSSHSDLSVSASDSDVLMNTASKGADVNMSSCSSESERESLVDDFESGSMGEPDRADDEFSWATGLGATATPPRVEYVIEEHITETTQEEYADADDDKNKTTDNSDIRSKRNRLTKQYSSIGEEPSEKSTVGSSKNSMPDLDFLNAWDIVKSHRVPFPEFGVDIVDDAFEYSDDEDENSGEKEDDISLRHSYVTAWEENWLFRKKKMFPFGGMRHQLLGFFGEPPCLLIPNSQDGISHAQIDSRDVDQLSDLSEKNSVGSLDFSDSNDDSDSEANNKGADELVRLAQSVAKHFAETNNQTNVSATKDTIINGTERISIMQPSPKTSKKQFLTTIKTAPPQSFFLPPPKFVFKQNRLVCNDPCFTSIPEDMAIHAGKVAQFTCQVKSLKPFGVSWYRKGDLLGDGGRFQIHQQPTRGRYILSVYDTDTDDTGIYSCAAYGPKGTQQWVDFNLNVKTSTRANCPPEFVVPLRVVSSVPELAARLTCTLSGYPEPRVMFFHNRRPLIYSEKTMIENVGYGEWIMDIGDLGLSDEGGYEVVASNRVGHAVSSVTHRIGEITHLPVANEKSDKKKELRNEAISACVEEVVVKPVEFHKTINIAKTRKISPPIVIQRTWVERKFEIENKNKVVVESKKSEYNGSNGHTNQEFSQPADFSCPPKPGTLADREHKKWEMAAPMQNNPYSRENVTKKRLERRISDISLKEPAMTFDEFSKQRELDEMQMGRNGLNKNVEKEYARYQRDYYVNGSVNPSGSRRSSKSSTGGDEEFKSKANMTNAVHKTSQPKEVFTSLEEKVFTRASQLITLEDHVHHLVREVESPSNDLTREKVADLENRVAEVQAQVESSSRHVSRVESEVELLQRHREYNRKNSVCSSSESSSINTNGLKVSPSSISISSDNDDDYCTSLPSVKKLANLFVSPSSQCRHNNTPLRATHSNDDKEVIIIESSPDSYSSSSINSCSIPLVQNNYQQQVSNFQMAPKYQVATGQNEKQGKEAHPNNSSGSDKRSHPAMPVVKMLSRQFTNNELAGASVQRVHSLTARSLSKEFRQLSQKNLPRPMNRTLSLTSNSSQPTSLETDRSCSPVPLNGGSFSPMPYGNSSAENILSPGGGYTSDESSATSNPSSSLPRQRNKRNSMSKAILQRTSYWERRADQGLLSDTSVNEEFPSIEEQKRKAQS